MTTRPDHPSDAAAIGRSLREPRAFTAVFDRHFDAIHGYASRRAGSELADEITAETFTRAFERRARYDLERDDARPWLLGIASNLLRRHWRTERRRLAAYHRAAQPSSRVDTSLTQGAIDALDSLPARDREALLLYAWADLTYEEVALALGVPVGTVRSRLARARRRLRERIGDDHVPRPAHPSKESSHV